MDARTENERLAGRLIADEMDYRRLKVKDVVLDWRLSPSTIAKAKNGNMTGVTRRQIEIGFGWPRHLLDYIADGRPEAIARLSVDAHFRPEIKRHLLYELGWDAGDGGNSSGNHDRVIN